jgi:hypothetical protein
MHQSWSPRWRGHLCRPVAEDALALRFDRRMRAMLGNAGKSIPPTISCIWKRGDQRVAMCQISLVYSAGDTLAIQLSTQVAEVAITQTVAIDWVVQRLAGQRAWWLCPGCQRRCGVLFNPTGEVWSCRACAKITYSSSNASDRRVTAALKSGDLATALEAMGQEVAIGSLILRQKTDIVIRRRARRDYRRWFRRTYPHRHMPASLRSRQDSV